MAAFAGRRRRAGCRWSGVGAAAVYARVVGHSGLLRAGTAVGRPAGSQTQVADHVHQPRHRHHRRACRCGRGRRRRCYGRCVSDRNRCRRWGQWRGRGRWRRRGRHGKRRGQHGQRQQPAPARPTRPGPPGLPARRARPPAEPAEPAASGRIAGITTRGSNPGCNATPGWCCRSSIRRSRRMPVDPPGREPAD